MSLIEPSHHGPNFEPIFPKINHSYLPRLLQFIIGFINTDGITLKNAKLTV